MQPLSESKCERPRLTYGIYNANEPPTEFSRAADNGLDTPWPESATDLFQSINVHLPDILDVNCY